MNQSNAKYLMWGTQKLPCRDFTLVVRGIYVNIYFYSLKFYRFKIGYDFQIFGKDISRQNLVL